MVTKEEILLIDDICNKYNIKNYHINDDGSIDVDGDVDMTFLYIQKFPLKFNIVTGNFDCRECSLTTLEGCPSKIDGYFVISRNWLTEFDYFPKSIGGEIYTTENNFTKKSYMELFKLGYTPDQIHCREDITDIYRMFTINNIIC